MEPLRNTSVCRPGRLTGPDVVIGVESKLTEPLTRHHATVWRSAYGREASRGLLSDGWLQTLDDALSGRYRTKHVDADQLLKHALGLSKQHPGRVCHLLYVYWEPANGDDFEAIIQHRSEVAELLERVDGASPQLHALSYTELWQQWDGLADLDWVALHLDALRGRYAIAL
jgi:hypothetical protein